MTVLIWLPIDSCAESQVTGSVTRGPPVRDRLDGASVSGILLGLEVRDGDEVEMAAVARVDTRRPQIARWVVLSLTWRARPSRLEIGCGSARRSSRREMRDHIGANRHLNASEQLATEAVRCAILPQLDNAIRQRHQRSVMAPVPQRECADKRPVNVACAVRCRMRCSSDRERVSGKSEIP